MEVLRTFKVSTLFAPLFIFQKLWCKTIQNVDNTLMPCKHCNCSAFFVIRNKYLPLEYNEKAENKGFGLTEIKKFV